MPGAADRSYGIQVARLAGMPPSVVTRAREILAGLEVGEGLPDTSNAKHKAGPVKTTKENSTPNLPPKTEGPQLDLFA